FALVDRRGKNVTGFIYDDLGDAKDTDGLIRARRTGLYRFLAPNGDVEFETNYALVGDFCDDRAWFRDKTGFGYIGRDGKPAFTDRFEAADAFSSELAVVRPKGSTEYMYITPAGKGAFGGKKFQFAQPFVGSLAVVQQGGKLGVIKNDKDGTEVFKVEYDQV